jgi:Rieske Fe-S protein
MNRRTFTKNACLMCLGATLAPSILSGCQATHYATGTFERNGISVLKSEFTYLKKDQQQFRSYIIIRNDQLQFPIYLYRFSDDKYSALLMKCTHQGAELSAAGDHLHCPSHGSEFDNNGTMTQGPAEKNLRSFKVTINTDKLLIDLS